MTKVVLSGIFSFLNSWKKIFTVCIFVLLGYGGYLFQNDISKIINGEYVHSEYQIDIGQKVTAVFETAQQLDHNVVSIGVWHLSSDKTSWECHLGTSVVGTDLCNQTKSFPNSDFVKKFQLRLELEDTIIIEIDPRYKNDPNSKFNRFWKGTYQTVFGYDRGEWKDILYVIYFQVADRPDLRVVAYSKDMNSVDDLRKLVNTYGKDIINMHNHEYGNHEYIATK